MTLRRLHHVSDQYNSGENAPVNVGNPNEMSILEFARTINRITGNQAGIVFGPLPTDDPHIRQPDISRARMVLGWQPQVSLENGLVRTIEYCRARF